ncbi:hypothetical protein K474DRAFT_1585487 [Panus rudis PR-1116 ss-1]|nr:hypothetical protein K474DRAFT_1585487 [Panus rudis PR-1116 ss-1]
MCWVWYRRRRRFSRVSSTEHTAKVTSLAVRLLCATVSAFRIIAYRWRIPDLKMNLLEVFLTVAYIVVLFCFEFSNTQNLQVRYWANRAGHIAAVQFPLIVALSSKNNLIQILTGISHEKLNVLHRVISRVVLVMVWVHLWGSHNNWWNRPWVVAGFAAGVIQTVLNIISIAPIRKRFYELFYATHIILALASLILLFVHCHGASEDYGYYIWPCFVVWGVDRVARWLRYVLQNRLLRLRQSSGELQLVSGDTLRLTMRRHMPFGWKAGQHMFLAFPTLNPMQSHPFTIATTYNHDGASSDLMFVIRVREGFTKRLRDHVHADGICQIPVYVDGPYGAPPDITPFHTCIFLTGGSGVSFTLPRFKDLLRQAGSGSACARRGVFVWAVREQAHVEWISRELLSTLTTIPADLSIAVFIYITGALERLPARTFEREATAPSSISDIEKQSGPCDPEKISVDVNSSADSLENVGVKFFFGRPNIQELLREEVNASSGAVSVDVSGPESLVAAARYALSSPIAGPMGVFRGAPVIQLNVETFTM